MVRSTEFSMTYCGWTSTRSKRSDRPVARVINAAAHVIGDVLEDVGTLQSGGLRAESCQR